MAWLEILQTASASVAPLGTCGGLPGTPVSVGSCALRGILNTERRFTMLIGDFDVAGINRDASKQLLVGECGVCDTGLWLTMAFNIHYEAASLHSKCWRCGTPQGSGCLRPNRYSAQFLVFARQENN